MTQDDDDFDTRGLLRDGRRLRTPMQAMDSLSRSVAQGVADRRRADDAARRFGLADSSALHRPGQRFAVDARARARVEEAYQEMVADMCSAWKTPAADAVEFRGQRPGDQCTIDGAPGHLDARLRCVPDRRQDSAPVYDAVEGQRIKDAAYAEMVAELTTAWQRKP